MLRYLAILMLFFILGSLFNCHGHHQQEDSTAIEAEVVDQMEGLDEYDIEDEAEPAGEVENPNEEEEEEEHPEDNPEVDPEG